MQRLLSTALAVAVLWGTPAVAWTDFGHMEIAAAAWTQLTPTARSNATRLLQHHPRYDAWIANAAAGDQERIAFIRASARPDTGEPKAADLAVQIATLRAALADPKAGDELKLLDMIRLVTLVADVHQPLYRAAIEVRCDVGSCRGATELHAFWSSLLGSGDSPLLAAAAAERLGKPEADQAAMADEAVWVMESVAVARKFGYRPQPAGSVVAPMPLSQKYQDDALAMAHKRAALAAARLANLLNAALRSDFQPQVSARLSTD